MSSLTTERLGEPSRAPSRLAAPERSASGPSIRGFRPDIQGLRAVAILAVVLYHSAVPFVTGGFVGVDVFFVISGFLITQHLLRENRATGTVSLSRFYARRIRRLLPSALLVILVTVIVARLWGPTLQATSTARAGFFATFYSINYWLAAQGVDYQHSTDAVSPLQHFWSLAVEEQFYLVWPVVILVVGLVVRRRGPRAVALALVAAVAVLGAASLWASSVVTVSDAPLAYFSLATRGWELGAGAIIAIASPVLARIPSAVAVPASWLGALAVVVSVVAFSDATPFPGTWALVPVLGSGAIIAAGLVERRGSIESVLRGRVLQFLGTVSYGWYLWHWPLIVLGPSLFGEKFGWVENLTACVIALWLATLSYLLLERSVLRRPLVRRVWYVRGVVGSAVVGSIALALSVVQVPVPGGASAAMTLQSVSENQLTARLADAALATALPAHLTPTLAKAANDQPVTTDDGCHVGLLATTNTSSCVFGDTSASRTILLFGDSHAQQWFGSLDALATTRHWKLVSWTKAACPLADVTLRNPVLKRKYTECSTWRANSLAEIARLRPRLIVASQADSLPGAAFSDAAWAKGTVGTLTALRRVAPVVLVQDTPHPGIDVPACLAAHATDIRDCGAPTFSSAEARWLGDRRTAVATAVRGTRIPIVDPTSWFCTARACPAVVGHVLVYRDDSHMTESYSRTLEKVLGDALRPYLSTS